MATALQEALTAVGAAPLIQKEIDSHLLELVRRYSPVISAISTVKWGSNVYYFNNRSQLPVGGFVTDGGGLPVSTSVYNQNLYPIKNLQIVGAVTGYAQAVTADLIGNLRAREMEGAAKSLYWSIENAAMWGNADSTLNSPQPQFDGFDTLISTFSGDNQNTYDWSGTGEFSLGLFDEVIDLVESNVGEPVQNSGWFFAVSPKLDSRLAQLFTNQQRFNENVGYSGMVEVATGLNVPSYRNVPILKSTFLDPRTYVMNTVSASPTNSGGTLAAGEYFYRVSAVIDLFGEIQASVECDATVSGGASLITLSFTPPTGYQSGGAVLYKVYRSSTTGAETLLGYVSANIGQDGLSAVKTNQIVDTGSALIPQNSSGPVQPSVLPTVYYNTNVNMKPLSENGQNLYLLPRNPDFLVRPYVREMQPVDIYPTTVSPDSLPFAMVADTTISLRAPSYAGRGTNFTVTLEH